VTERDEEERAAHLAAIRAAPEDDAPRLVYADWLLLRGEPRGELIQLSCLASRRALVRREQARLRVLVTQHERRWLGPVHRVTVRTLEGWRRGWLERCGLVGDAAAVEAALGHPEWAFVASLMLGLDTVGVRDAIVALVRSLPSLRRLDRCPTDVAERLFAGPEPLALGSLGVAGVREASFRRVLDAPAGLPALRRLELWLDGDGPIQHRWLLATAAVARVEELELSTGAAALPEWLWTLDDHAPPSLETVGLDHGVFTLRRGDEGRWSELAVDGSRAGVALAPGHVRALERVPPDALTRLTLARRALGDPWIEVVERVRARQTRLAP
jgi:uncharacterized protein (TIGR02996 family)